jgi:Predicted permeases
MIIFFLLMILGMVAFKKGIITETNQSQISSLVVNIAYPAIILSGVAGGGARIEGMDLLLAVGAALLVIGLSLLCARLVPLMLGYPKAYHGIINVMVVFTNIGFMGVPMINGIYGESALIYMTVFLIPFNLLFYSYAMQTVRGNRMSTNNFQWRNLLNPGIISCFVSIILYFANIHLPYVLTESIQMVGNMTAPLAMMLVGSFLIDIKWWELLTDKKIILFTIVKMLVLPVLIVLILEQFIHNKLLLAVCMAALSTPSGNVIALLAAVYNKEAYPIAVKGIALTTLASVITMPLAFMLAGLE